MDLEERYAKVSDVDIVCLSIMQEAGKANDLKAWDARSRCNSTNSDECAVSLERTKQQGFLTMAVVVVQCVEMDTHGNDRPHQTAFPAPHSDCTEQRYKVERRMPRSHSISCRAVDDEKVWYSQSKRVPERSASSNQTLKRLFKSKCTTSKQHGCQMHASAPRLANSLSRLAASKEQTLFHPCSVKGTKCIMK